MSVIGKPWKLSVKVLIFNDKGQCLLLKRSLKSKGNPGRWEPVGGKIDPGESFDGALLREIQEETGLKVTLQHAVGIAESELSKLRIVHLILEGKLESGQVQLSEEHIGYIWAKPTEFEALDLADWFNRFAKGYRKNS